VVKEQEPQTHIELSEEELLIVDILQRMQKGNLRRKKVSKRAKEISQTRTLPQEEKLETKRRKVQGLQTSGLRRSTRLSTVQQTISKATVMKLAHKKIEKIDQRLRNKPLRGGNLLYFTQMNNS